MGDVADEVQPVLDTPLRTAEPGLYEQLRAVPWEQATARGGGPGRIGSEEVGRPARAHLAQHSADGRSRRRDAHRERGDPARSEDREGPLGCLGGLIRQTVVAD